MIHARMCPNGEVYFTVAFTEPESMREIAEDLKRIKNKNRQTINFENSLVRYAPHMEQRQQQRHEDVVDGQLAALRHILADDPMPFDDDFELDEEWEEDED